MAEIIDLQKYRRTCENCRWWVPPKWCDDHTRILKDSRCGRPGGWTLDPRTERCNEFCRRAGE